MKMTIPYKITGNLNNNVYIAFREAYNGFIG